jgi:plastocyanin
MTGILLRGLAAAMLALAAFSPIGASVAPAPGAGMEVKIDNFTFNPPRLTVSAGTTVTWDNEDDIPHTVAASGKLFKSKCSIPQTNSRSRSRHPACSNTFAPCIRT